MTKPELEEVTLELSRIKGIIEMIEAEISDEESSGFSAEETSNQVNLTL